MRKVQIGVALLALILSGPAFATLQGLNQIVTPDIQPVGLLGVTASVANPALGSSSQMELEVGLTDNFAIALFHGFEPRETSFGAEFGLLRKKPFLLSFGATAVEDNPDSHPFIEAGYYSDNWIAVAGIMKQDDHSVGLFGFYYQITPRISIAADYISGSPNFATFGVNFYLTPSLSFNPCLYISNSADHQAYGFASLTWGVEIW